MSIIAAVVVLFQEVVVWAVVILVIPLQKSLDLRANAAIRTKV